MQMRLVLEYCDRGSLASYLKHHQGMRDISGSFQIANLIETAADIVKGMLHLHMNDICHNDLKAANVLLKSEGTDGRGVRAKVMDFGLSIKLDSKATHVSNLFQGTFTHMVSNSLHTVSLADPFVV
jgi:serine/threonine protein kinase